MVKGLVDKEHIEDIGKAIREKNGETSTYYPVEMGGKIRGLNGTTDYESLENLPKINNTILKGNKSLEDLGINLDDKQDKLISGRNVKTVGGKSILGSGDIPISEGGTSDYDDLDNKPQVNNITLKGNKSLEDLGIQETIKSGVNLATINNKDLTKGGNIVIGGEGGTTDYDELENRPQINNKTLTGNKSLTDLGIQEELKPDVNIIGEGNTTVSKNTNNQLVIKSTGGGEGGTSDYNELENLPTMNNKTIKGDLSPDILGLQEMLISGSNIKRINGESVLGEGNIVIGGGGGTSDYNDLNNKPQINNITIKGNKSLEDLGIQETIVSGVNLATINDIDLTKGGNIVVGGGEGGTSNYNDLENKPQINNVTLTGNKSLKDIGIDLSKLVTTETFDSLRHEVDGLETLKADKRDLEDYQKLLTAGDNITIDENNVISAVGGEGGTSNYNDLENKPQINHITIKGDISLTDLGVQERIDTLTENDWKNVKQRAENSVQKDGFFEDTYVELADRTGGMSTQKEYNNLMYNAVEGKQDKLTAGQNITINDNVISATGSGNVRADWTETDEDAESFIEHKPDLSVFTTKNYLEQHYYNMESVHGLLDNKQDVLKPDVNIKGDGNTSVTKDEETGVITIKSTGGEGGTSDYNDLENLPTINNKTIKGDMSPDMLGLQEALVSGLNIKKVNGESVLGEGNIVFPFDSGVEEFYEDDNIHLNANFMKIGNCKLVSLNVNHKGQIVLHPGTNRIFNNDDVIPTDFLPNTTIFHTIQDLSYHIDTNGNIYMFNNTTDDIQFESMTNAIMYMVNTDKPAPTVQPEFTPTNDEITIETIEE